MIELINVTKKYKRNTIIKDLNLKFPSTGLFFIMGKSGEGKSTLLNIISLVDRKIKGEILFDNEKIRNAYKFRRENIAYINTTTNFLKDLSIYENLVFLFDSFNKKIDEDKLAKYLKDLDLDERILHSHIDEVSGGELSRLSILKGLMLNQKIFLLDEMSQSLDLNNALKLKDILKTISKDALIIFATHDERIVEESDKVISISEHKFNFNYVNENENFKPIEKNNNYSFNFFFTLKFAIKNFFIPLFEAFLIAVSFFCISFSSFSLMNYSSFKLDYTDLINQLSNENYPFYLSIRKFDEKNMSFEEVDNFVDKYNLDNYVLLGESDEYINNRLPLYDYITLKNYNSSLFFEVIGRTPLSDTEITVSKEYLLEINYFPKDDNESLLKYINENKPKFKDEYGNKELSIVGFISPDEHFKSEYNEVIEKYLDDEMDPKSTILFEKTKFSNKHIFFEEETKKYEERYKPSEIIYPLQGHKDQIINMFNATTFKEGKTINSLVLKTNETTYSITLNSFLRNQIISPYNAKTVANIALASILFASLFVFVPLIITFDYSRIMKFREIIIFLKFNGFSFSMLTLLFELLPSLIALVSSVASFSLIDTFNNLAFYKHISRLFLEEKMLSFNPIFYVLAVVISLILSIITSIISMRIIYIKKQTKLEKE